MQFQNVMGPAHRGATIQQMAQSAAKNVMRSQKLKQLLHTSAGALAAGGPMRATVAGNAPAFRGSMTGHSIGQRGNAASGLSQAALARLMAGANTPGQFANGAGGMFNPGQGGGGGYDFASVPDAGDPSQSPDSLFPTPFTPDGPDPLTFNPGGPMQPAPAPAAPTGTSVGPYQIPAPIQGVDTATGAPTGPVNTGAYAPPPASDAEPSGGNTINGWIPLGGGMFYDPVNDQVRGQTQVSAIDKKF